MNNEDNENLKKLLLLTPDIKYFTNYNYYFEKIIGRKNHSNCNKCAIKRIFRTLRNYINKIN